LIINSKQWGDVRTCPLFWKSFTLPWLFLSVGLITLYIRVV